MARKRFTGLSATLGTGGLAAGATSMPLTAALTYDNGTAVPTVASPDYIPFSILDPNGHVSEIVWGTYTTGASSVAVVRGKEGTPNGTHPAGVKIDHGPTAADFAGPSDLFPVADYGAVGDATTDDTAAIIAAIDACAAAGGGTVTFEAKTYLCNGALRTDRHGNAIIPLPTGGAPIRLRGVTPANNCDPRTSTGYTVLKTTVTGLTRSTTYGVPSLLGGPTDTTWAETMVSVENICFWLPHNPTIAGVDLVGVRRMLWDGSTVIAINTGDADYVQPTSVYAFGLRTPREQNYNAVLIRSGQAHGMYAGLVGATESLTLTYWCSKWCVIGWAPMTSGHGGHVAKMSLEACNYHVSGWSETAGVTSLVDSASGMTTAQVFVGELAIEDAPGTVWYNTTEHIHDPTNRLYGVAYFERFSGSAPTSAALTVNGATNLTRIALLAPSFGTAAPSLTVQDENANVSTAVTQIDFQGAGVTATAGTGEVVVTIPGSGSSTTYREALMESGTSPPAPLESSAGGDWLYGEAP